ncbi:hypothetical protein DL768_011655 [Monosporascus sp. mg162]|nr:hypothetical protein DL768_011655 [Monosporascus sp. mg162]
MPDPYLLWVDAVRINQNDEEDKRAQVRLVCDIYRRAAMAISWIAPPADYSDGALQSLELLSQITFGHRLYDTVHGFPRRDEERDKVRELIGQIDMGPTNWHDVPQPAAEALFERPYWHRV